MADLIQQDTAIWYLNGKYQGGTPQGYESINVYDSNTGIVIVFLKSENGSGSYLTSCRMTKLERAHFENTGGNFLTERMINNQQSLTEIKDLPAPVDNNSEQNN